MKSLRAWAVCPCCAVVLLAATSLRAGSVQVQWNSPTVGNWTDPTKWTPAGVPGTSDPEDRAYIGSGAGNGGTAIIDTAVPPINSFNLGEGGVGTLEVRRFGSLTTTNSSADTIGLNGQGTLLVSGGIVTLGRRLVVNRGAIDVSAGSLRLPSGRGDISLAVSGTGELTVRGTGALEVGQDFVIGDGGEGHVSLVSGGQAYVTRNVVVGGPFGVCELEVDGGFLRVDGNVSIGAATSEGALLFGPSLSVVDVAGTLSVTATGELHRTFGMTATAVLRAGVANLLGDLSVTLDGFNPPPGQILKLLEVSGSAAHAATFAGKPQGTVFLADAGTSTVPLLINYQANLDGGAVANDVTLTVVRQGDVTLDGAVNRADVAALVANWHGTGGFAQGDLDGDGVVGLLDLMTLRRQLASGAASAAVPEPASLVMMLAAISCIAVWRGQFGLGLARAANRR